MSQSYKSYLEHRKSHQLLSAVMGEGNPMAQEWMGQERICFILKWLIWTWLKTSITLCMIQSAGRVNSLPVTEEFRVFFQVNYCHKGDFWGIKVFCGSLLICGFCFFCCLVGFGVFFSKSHKTIFRFLTALSPCTFYT